MIYDFASLKVGTLVNMMKFTQVTWLLIIYLNKDALTFEFLGHAVNNLKLSEVFAKKEKKTAETQDRK